MAPRPPESEPHEAYEPCDPIYTVGYGARSFDEFVALLRRYEIACLVDVRSAPYSRYRPEFSKQALDLALSAQSIRYVFLGNALGGRPDDPDCYVAGKVDYDRVGEKEGYRRGIERVRRAAGQGIRLALMCSEGRPEDCHRSKLLGASLEKVGVPVLHIDTDGALQPQSEVIERLTGGQLDLFGDPSFTSRKRYIEPREE